jgi:hypothetical protein
MDPTESNDQQQHQTVTEDQARDMLAQKISEAHHKALAALEKEFMAKREQAPLSEHARLRQEEATARDTLAMKIEEFHREALKGLSKHFEAMRGPPAAAETENYSRDHVPAAAKGAAKDAGSAKETEKDAKGEKRPNVKEHPLHQVGSHLQGIHNGEVATERLITGMMQGALSLFGFLRPFFKGKGEKDEPEQKPDDNPKKDQQPDLEVLGKDGPKGLSAGKPALPEGAIDIEGAQEGDGSRKALPAGGARLLGIGDQSKAQPATQEPSAAMPDGAGEKASGKEAPAGGAVGAPEGQEGANAGKGQGKLAQPAQGTEESSAGVIGAVFSGAGVAGGKEATHGGVEADTEATSVGVIALPIEKRASPAKAENAGEVIPLPSQSGGSKGSGQAHAAVAGRR